jgi:hypothetical protein
VAAHVAGAAHEREQTVDDAERGVVGERLRRLCLGEERRDGGAIAL